MRPGLRLPIAVVLWIGAACAHPGAREHAPVERIPEPATAEPAPVEPAPVEPASAEPPSVEPAAERELVVTATAYNSLPGQTSGDPTLAAWGDRLQPGTRAIAVSPDLLELGLTRGTAVRIEGLPGEYEVLDKMPRRWTRSIDIYMGTDRAAARRWGRRRVRIFWLAPGP